MPLSGITYALNSRAVTGTWANIAQCRGKNIEASTWTTWTSSTSGASASMELYDFGVQGSLPSASVTPTQVRVTIVYATSSTSTISTLVGRFYNGTTALGTNITMTKTANAWTELSYTLANPTYAQLADLRFRITATRAFTSTQSIVYIDRALVDVTYTYTFPTGEPGIYTLMLDEISGSPTASLAGAYAMGTQFEIDATDKYLLGLRLWNPTDLSLGSGITGVLYLATSTLAGSQVSGTSVTFPNMAAQPPDQWVTAWLPAPVALTAGEQYIATVRYPTRYLSNAVYISADTDYEDSRVRAAPNARWADGAAGMAFPVNFVDAGWYWTDAVIGDLTPQQRYMLATAGG